MRAPLLIAVLCLILAGAGAPAQDGHRGTKPAGEAQRLEPVDINHASADELMRIPGLTKVWAARIVKYRPYRGKNQLLLDGIVPARIYDKIKDHIVAHRDAK